MNKNCCEKPKETCWASIFRQRQETRALERFHHVSDEIKKHNNTTFFRGILKLPNMTEVLSKMTCVSCNSVASPYHRYLCPNGHIFCATCGNERRWMHQSKCFAEICLDKEVKASNGDGSDLSDCSSYGNDVLPKKKGKYSSHFELCQLKIQVYPADPIYTSVWLNTVWKCPLHKGACTEQVLGWDLELHMEECKNNPAAAPEVFKCLGDDCFKTVPLCGQSHVEHLVSDHNIYGLEMGDGSEPKLLYVPGSAIEKNKPYYAMLHCLDRNFLFCMEPTPIASDMRQEMRISVKEICDRKHLPSANKFQCNLYLITRWGLLKVITKFDCVPLTNMDNKADEKHCLILPTDVIKSEHVFPCNESYGGCKRKTNRSRSRKPDEEVEELGYFLVNLTISVRD